MFCIRINKCICAVALIGKDAFFSGSGGDHQCVTLLHFADGFFVYFNFKITVVSIFYLTITCSNDKFLHFIADVRRHSIGNGLTFRNYVDIRSFLSGGVICIRIVSTVKNRSAVFQRAAPVAFAGSFNLTVLTGAGGIAIPNLLAAEHEGVHVLFVGSMSTCGYLEARGGVCQSYEPRSIRGIASAQTRSVDAISNELYAVGRCNCMIPIVFFHEQIAASILINSFTITFFLCFSYVFVLRLFRRCICCISTCFFRNVRPEVLTFHSGLLRGVIGNVGVWSYIYII